MDGSPHSRTPPAKRVCSSERTDDSSRVFKKQHTPTKNAHLTIADAAVANPGVPVANDSHASSPERVVQIRRCACVVKGGRRFSFAALVVVGDENGRVGFGYGKATEVPLAVEKAKSRANKKMRSVQIDGTTISHQVMGRFGAAKVLLVPASPGTGIIAGATVRAVVESAGIKDILTKSRGSNNPVNLVKATLNALEKLRSREDVARLRGVEI